MTTVTATATATDGSRRDRALDVPNNTVRGGCELNLMIGIDYTASNGQPSDAASLHHFSPQGLNQYQQAMFETVRILQHYDSDKLFPVYGFGGQLGGAHVNHCFPLTMNPSQPHVHGVDGIMQVYAESFQHVVLSGPTLFAPYVRSLQTCLSLGRSVSRSVCTARALLTHSACTCCSLLDQACAAASQHCSQTDQKYFVLMILTDGAIMDMQPTIDALVRGSRLPLSVVIVGVGDADFASMKTLDGDGQRLRATNGTVAVRDIVQFVPFNQVRHQSIGRLAAETLSEIPRQLMSYMKAVQFTPTPCLDTIETLRARHTLTPA